MKKKAPFSWKQLTCLGVVTIALAGGCTYFNKKLGWADDNPVEEILEEVVERQTGFKIDFTPKTPEL